MRGKMEVSRTVPEPRVKGKGSASRPRSARKLRQSPLTSCNQFRKDTVALRVFKPWGFKLNHTCHVHRGLLMSVCKYLIFSICITQPDLPCRPPLPAFADTIIQPRESPLVSETRHAPLCLPLHACVCPCLDSPLAFPFRPLNTSSPEDELKYVSPFAKPFLKRP